MAAVLALHALTRGHMVRRQPWRLAVALLLAAGCGEPPRLEILPSRVQVDILAIPTGFRVAAHLRDRHGEILSNPIRWSFPPGMGIASVDPTNDPNVMIVTLDPNAQVGRPVQLTAETDDGEYSAVAVLSFVKGDALSGDRALANHQNAGFPSVALVGGSLGGCVRDSIFPFVQAGELGDWTTDTCEQPLRPAAVFALDRAPKFDNPWQHPAPPPVYDELNAVIVTLPPEGTDPGPPAPAFVTVPLHAWNINAVASEVAGRFEDERQVANARFAEALTGIVFTPAGSTDLNWGADVLDCDDLRELLEIRPAHPDVLNVYFAKTLNGRRGWWCGGPDGSGTNYPGNLILLALDHSFSNTLAHEIGHALALMEPWDFSGHADGIKGMSYDNLMASGMDDAGTATRRRFSIGQVFRMHFDKRSWLQRGNALALDCGCDPYPRRVCPRVAADVTPLADTDARLPGGACP